MVLRRKASIIVPVYVDGIKAGDVIAVTITDLSVVGHCSIGTGEDTLLPQELVTKRCDFIRIRRTEPYAHGYQQLG